MRRILLRSASVLLLSGLLAGCPTTPESVPPVVADRSTFLGLAVGQVAELSDEVARAELYTALAGGYRALNDVDSVRSLATRALELLRAAGLTEDSVRARLALAPLLAFVNAQASARSVLQDGLAYAAGSTDSQLRSVFLPLVVESALRTDDAAPEVLRTAVDEVYVTEDPRRRAEALIRIAELYQTGSRFLPVTGLIQQAIPAIRSAEDPFQRAALFTRLALVADETDEPLLASRLGDAAVADILGSGQKADGSNAELLLLSVERLALLGRREEAPGLLDVAARPYYRLRAHLLLAQHEPDRDVRLARIRAAARLISELSAKAEQVDARIRVGFGYLDAGESGSALSHAQTAADLIAGDESIYSRIEPAVHLAELLVRLDRIEPIRELLELAPDNYIRGSVAVRTATALINDGRLLLADDFLTLSLLASDRATYLADGLRQRIVAGFARTGSIRLAIRTIERMEDELLFARSVVELAVVAEPAGLVNPLYRADLASALASR